MNTITLCRLACSDRKIRFVFGGIYPSDMLPRKTDLTLYIANLDPHTLPGSHWIAIHFSRKNAYYFDSYGNKPTNKNILNFMRRNADTIFYNKVCFQSKWSATCGHYCLFFLYHRVRQLKMKQLDDELIKQFVLRHFKLRRCCHLSHGKRQKCRPWIKMRSVHHV